MPRADVGIDLRASGLRGYREALGGVDAVVNAAGAEDPALGAASTERDAVFIDATATASYAGPRRHVPTGPPSRIVFGNE